MGVKNETLAAVAFILIVVCLVAIFMLLKPGASTANLTKIKLRAEFERILVRCGRPF